MSDSFYTPKALARHLLAAANVLHPKRVADFAVGAGSLLAAASERWPDASLYGVDLNPSALSEMLSILPDTITFEGDFLSDAMEEKLTNLPGTFDVIVLNPPFTCRGSSTSEVKHEGIMIRASKAMAFILRSCHYLSERGEVLAIVPKSCLFSEKDLAARSALREKYVIHDLGTYDRPGFARASVIVHLVSIRRKLPAEHTFEECDAFLPRLRPSRSYDVAIMRGSHAARDGLYGTAGHSLIHTTDLFNSQISISRRRAIRNTKLVSGTVVMLPRVGRPDIGKISIGNFLHPVVPSDCIICVKTHPEGEEMHLMSQIVRFWKNLENAYSGTCAPYITMKTFAQFLTDIGYNVRNTEAEYFWHSLGCDNSSTKKKSSITISDR